MIRIAAGVFTRVAPQKTFAGIFIKFFSFLIYITIPPEDGFWSPIVLQSVSVCQTHGEKLVSHLRHNIIIQYVPSRRCHSHVLILNFDECDKW